MTATALIAPDITGRKLRTADLFETTECGRCGGCGRYSWCSQWGDRCFGCGGSGIKLTTNGARARKAWIAAYTKTAPVTSIVPGDKVVETMSGKRIVKTVTESHADPLNEGHWTLRYDTNGNPGNLGGHTFWATQDIDLPVSADEKNAAYAAIYNLKGAILGK